MIDAQKGMTYFHIELNFDPKREDKNRDLDLRAITKQTIRALEDRLQRQIGFIAAEHTDHSASNFATFTQSRPIKLKKGRG